MGRPVLVLLAVAVLGGGLAAAVRLWPLAGTAAGSTVTMAAPAAPAAVAVPAAPAAASDRQAPADRPLAPAATADAPETFGLPAAAYENVHQHVDDAILRDDSRVLARVGPSLEVLDDTFDFAGLRSGDRIAAVNGIAVDDLRASGELGSVLSGGYLRFDVVRGGAQRRVVVRLEY